MVEIIPAILTNNTQELKDLLAKAEGVVQRVQIDILDGVFADNKTIDPRALEAIETDLKFDFHLMVKEPVNWVERSLRAGAERIIGQVEMMTNQLEFVGKVQEVGLSVGLAIDVATGVDAIEPTILRDLDAVLVMSVPAGFGGQAFDSKVLKKIDELVEIRRSDQTPFKIIDDGGITLETIGRAHADGVDEVAVGKRIFEGDIKENIKNFQLAAHQTK